MSRNLDRWIWMYLMYFPSANQEHFTLRFFKKAYNRYVLLLLGKNLNHCWSYEFFFVVVQVVLPFSFLSSILSFPSYCSLGWRISIAVELTGSVVLIGQWRISTVAALTCVCIAEPQPGNTRSILMTSPTPTLCFCLPLFAVKTSSRSLSEKKGQASVKEQELIGKRRGCSAANGRKRV